MPPYNAPYLPVQRRRRLPAVAVGAPAASAPAATPVAQDAPSGGFLDQAEQWNQQNPGVLTSLASGLFSPAASNMANAFTNAAKLQQVNGNRAGMAKYLLDHGYADSPEEAQMLANNPSLQAALFKDNSYADLVTQRAKIAPLLGISGPDDSRYAQFVGAGSFDTSQNSSPTSMTPTERAGLADQYGLTGADRQRFILTGTMESTKSRGLSSTQARQLYKDQDALPGLENTMAVLDEAKGLLDSGKVRTGMGSGTAATLSVGAGGWGSLGSQIGGLVMDPESAEATKRFNDIMSEKAIATMSETLKGASTNYEMQQFLSIIADTNNNISLRRKALGQLIGLIQREYNMRKSRADQLGAQEDMGGGSIDTGTAPSISGGAAGGWSAQEVNP